MNMKGKLKRRISTPKAPNIVDGGVGIPVAPNMYLLRGRKHEQGGIDIGNNPRTGIEAEDGEIVELKPNELRVHSAQPILNGKSPAQKILGGANPDKVFKAQESYKHRNRIKDDGTKYNKGGMITINGNVKNGLLMTPRPTKKCGGRKKYVEGGTATGDTITINGKRYYKYNDAGTYMPVKEDKRKPKSREVSVQNWGGNLNEPGLIEQGIDFVGGLISDFKHNIDTGSNTNNSDEGLTFDRKTGKWVPKTKPQTVGDYIKSSIVPEEQRPQRNKKPVFNTATRRRQLFAEGRQAEEANRKRIADRIKSGMSIEEANKPDVSTQTTKRGNPIAVYNKVKDVVNNSVDNNDDNTPIMLRGVPKKNTIDTDKTKAVQASSAPSSIGGGAKAESAVSTKSASTGGTGSGSKRTNAKSVTNARVDKSWRETIGDDADVLNYIANGDMWEIKKQQDRHVAMRDRTGFKHGQSRAVSDSDAAAYQEDFNNRFNQANKKLELYTKKAGSTGDNQMGVKRCGGRAKAAVGTTKPYTDGYYGDMTDYRNLGRDLSLDDINYMQGEINKRRVSPKKRALMVRDNGYVGVIDELDAPKVGFNAPAAKRPDLGKINAQIKADLPKIAQRDVNKKLTERNKFKEGPTLGDWIGGGINITGALGDFIGTNAYLNKMKAPNVRLEAPVKLKTKFNINPQLDATKQAREQAFRDIDSNTASSSTALARKQNIRNQSLFATNQLWGDKENKETELINRDKLNLQGVRARNTQHLNRWEENKASVNNAKYQAKANNLGNMLGNISGTVNDVIGRIESRRRDNNTLGMIQGSNGNVDDRIFRDAGVQFDPKTRKYINTKKGVAAAKYGKRIKLR